MDENFIKFVIVSLFLAMLATPIVFFVQNEEKNTIYEVITLSYEILYITKMTVLRISMAKLITNQTLFILKN